MTSRTMIVISILSRCKQVEEGGSRFKQVEAIVLLQHTKGYPVNSILREGVQWSSMTELAACQPGGGECVSNLGVVGEVELRPGRP